MCFEFVVDGWRRCVCGEVKDGDECSLVAAGADGDVALFLEIDWVSMFFILNICRVDALFLLESSKFFFVSSGEETVMPDFDKHWRQDV